MSNSLHRLASLERKVAKLVAAGDGCDKCRDVALTLAPKTGFLPDAPEPGFSLFAGNEIFDSAGYCRQCRRKVRFVVRVSIMGGKQVWDMIQARKQTGKADKECGG